MKKRRIEKYPEIIVSATHIYNYMINDHLVDWLRIYKKEVYIRDEFTDYICNKGNEFETKLIQYINNNRIQTEFVSQYITDETCSKTIELMMQGVPLIHSAPVRNKFNNTHGIIDLLIRSDYLNRLVEYLPAIDFQADFKAPKLNGDYHYVVIDIKFSSLKIMADGKHLLNIGKQPAYKGQVKIYTDAIGAIQGYTSPYGFIMGRKYVYTRENRTENNCLYSLGIIDYSSVDRDYNYSTREAIQWVRLVKGEGSQWSISPPSRKELYPNMCIESGAWMPEKRRIAEEIKEITLIWNCGIKNRNIAIQNQICSWDNQNCTPTFIGINNSYTTAINSILMINRQTENNIEPQSNSLIQNNFSNWKTKENEIFVDFETISDIFTDLVDLPLENTTERLFMIGVGFINNEGVFEYKNFICNQLTSQEEKRILSEFLEWLEERENPKIFYWSAEPSIWFRAIKRNNISNSKNIKWCDLYRLFKTEPIVIRGCLDYSLKSVAKAMKKHNMINCSIEDNTCNSGMLAMLHAWKYYNSEGGDLEIMNSISLYNQFDCKVLYEILNYLRTYNNQIETQSVFIDEKTID